VHEYGGAACTVNSRGPAELIYTDWNSNGVFSVPIYSDSDAHASTTAPRCILQGSPSIRYADFDIHPRMERYFLAVQESHRDTEAVKNCVVLVDRDLKTATVVVQGADFYAHPRWSSDGSRVCWVQWMHPDMPWTGSQLYVAECEWSNQSSEDNNIKINLREKRYIAGVAGIESICQPRWAEDGELFFVSDRTGWWQMYVVNLATAGKDVCPTQRVRHLKLGGLEDAEFGCRELVLGRYVMLMSSMFSFSLLRQCRASFFSPADV
jgi:dipeptidyl aminopeptidase/acylaminoacyl peptidase